MCCCRQFRYEKHAARAVERLNSRWFNGRPVHAEMSPVTDFREACCRQYEMGFVLQTVWNGVCIDWLTKFYHVMLCIVWTMLSQDVRLSVYLSVTCQYSVEKAKHIIKLFSLWGSHTILVFSLPNGKAIFWRGLLWWGCVECKGQCWGEEEEVIMEHGTGTLRCLQKETATYKHWSVSLWRDPDDVSHCRILSPDKTEWRLISATLCGWVRCFVADQLW